MVSNIALWNRIACFTPDDPQADFQFTDRLARENGWSKAFAAGAVDEYKRFVYLAAVSTGQVTPSDIVDQVWHLHLTFTRSYWNDLCGSVLEKPLHHNPTKGGPAERARYRAQYAATLALYRREFGAAAPTAYWPDADRRFGSIAHQAWVDRRTHWVIAKPAGPRWPVWAALFGLGAAAAIGTAHSATTPNLAGFENLDWDLLVFAAIVLIVLSAVGSALEGHKRKKKDEGDGSFNVDFDDGGSRRGGKSDKDDGGEGGGEGGGDGGGCGGGCGGD